MDRPVAIVTGASRGIGNAIARRFIREGYNVTVNSEDVNELLNAFPDLPAKQILHLPGDLADLNWVPSLVEKTVGKWGRIDALINNAAWRVIEPLRTASLENWERTLRICLTTPAFLTKWVVSRLEAMKIPGVIINISSIMSERTAGTSAAYVVAKGGLLSLTSEMAALYGPSGIRVIAVSPGNITTRLSQDFVDPDGQDITDRLTSQMEDQTPLQRSGHPEEIANAVVWLCGSEASFITGTNLVIDGGFSTNFNSYELKKLQFPDQF
jgi:NAD(P)-dependent dehydrogenase (short-subunit alcohol dehydrogenase family)